MEEVAVLRYVPVSWVNGRTRKRSLESDCKASHSGNIGGSARRHYGLVGGSKHGAFLCLQSDSPPCVTSTRMNSASLSRDEIMAEPSPVSTESRRLASRFVILFLAPNGQVAAQTILASPRRYGRSSSLSFPERWSDKWLRFSASCQCIDADVSSCPYPLSAS